MGRDISNDYFVKFEQLVLHQYYRMIFGAPVRAMETAINTPTFPQIRSATEPMVSGGILAAHNALFDLRILKACLQFYNIYAYIERSDHY